MAKDKQYNKKGITPEKIIAYIESKTRKSQAKIGKQMGVSQRTISNWVGDVEEYVKQSDQYQQIGPRLCEMIPAALDNYDFNLNANELAAARDVLKMVGIYVDNRKIEINDNTRSDGELLDELGGIFGSDSAESDELPEVEGDSDNQGD